MLYVFLCIFVYMLNIPLDSESSSLSYNGRESQVGMCKVVTTEGRDPIWVGPHWWLGLHPVNEGTKRNMELKINT